MLQSWRAIHAGYLLRCGVQVRYALWRAARLLWLVILTVVWMADMFVAPAAIYLVFALFCLDLHRQFEHVALRVDFNVKPARGSEVLRQRLLRPP